MILKDLIEGLEKIDPSRIVKRGFGSPHSDRGFYEDLGFDPAQDVSIGSMLEHAKSAMGQTFTGWKGGEYQMGEFTDCHIGEYGTCGDEINQFHMDYWSGVLE
jgi:hypothetical protein